jgi:hypothetical protein
MMKWVPVSRERFESILAEETRALRPEVMRLYEQYAVSPFQQLCLREQNSPTEQVFVVADFGVATPDADGVLRNWGNYGPLVRAILVLDENASGASTCPLVRLRLPAQLVDATPPKY